jgi:hypothetical protein
MSMNKLAVAAAAFALSFVVFTGAQAQSVEVIEVVGHANGCTTTYLNTVADDGTPVGSVLLSCPRPTTQTATQIAQDPPAVLEQAVAKLN